MKISYPNMNKTLAWLMEEHDPGVRYLALRDLAGLADTGPELQAARRSAHQHGPIASILSNMHSDGFWSQAGPGYLPKYYSSVWSLIMLAQLGAHISEDKRIMQACAYILDNALTRNGQFSGSGTPGGTVDCLQGNLCWSLLELGCQDARLDLAFEWMARSVTGAGVASMQEKDADLRYYAGKCGPGFACGSNNKLPCAWGAVKVMLAFSHLPQDKRTSLVNDAIEEGIRFLFSVNPAQADYPCGYTEHPSGNWWKFGFPVFYVTDLLQLVEALVGLGFAADPRLQDALALIQSKMDELGRWALEYDYNGKTWVDFGVKQQPNKWVTLRALQVLQKSGI